MLVLLALAVLLAAPGSAGAVGTPVASPERVAPAQPAQPATGPGGRDAAFPDAHKTHYGPEPGGYWIWEPTAGDGTATPAAAAPLPVVLYLSGCCGNVTYPTPEEVDPWMTHLARRGSVVIAPVYNGRVDEAIPGDEKGNLVLADIQARLREALTELAAPGHAKVDLDRFAVVAYSFGGVPAVLYAASAAAEGLPVPKALYLNAPCANGFYCPGPPDGVLALPEGMKAVVLAFADDIVVGVDEPRRIYHALTGLPAADRDFVVMATDVHGEPQVLAEHETAFRNEDAADWFGIWKLSDALLACALDGEWCAYALGDTPEQRFMGAWSDGQAVTELRIFDDPGVPPAPLPD
jgi:dienelactone hydrolase